MRFLIEDSYGQLRLSRMTSCVF